MSPEVALVLAFVALVLGPFQAFRKILRKLEKVEQEVTRLRSDYRQAFMDQKIELFHGESSRKTRAQRAEELKGLYEPRRDEIRRGDFIRASEIVPILKHYVPLFRQVVPNESVALAIQMEEFKEIMDKVEGHVAETMRSSTQNYEPSAS